MLPISSTHFYWTPTYVPTTAVDAGDIVIIKTIKASVFMDARGSLFGGSYVKKVGNVSLVTAAKSREKRERRGRSHVNHIGKDHVMSADFDPCLGRIENGPWGWNPSLTSNKEPLQPVPVSLPCMGMSFPASESMCTPLFCTGMCHMATGHLQYCICPPQRGEGVVCSMAWEGCMQAKDSESAARNEGLSGWGNDVHAWGCSCPVSRCEWSTVSFWACDVFSLVILTKKMQWAEVLGLLMGGKMALDHENSSQRKS